MTSTQRPTPSRISAGTPPAAARPPREYKAAFAALGLRCVGGIGTSASGPLRLVNTPDVRLEVKRHQQYSPHHVGVYVELYVPDAHAEVLFSAVICSASAQRLHMRGSWICMGAVELCGTIERELAALAPGVKAMTPAERLEAAERWLDKRWG